MFIQRIHIDTCIGAGPEVIQTLAGEVLGSLGHVDVAILAEHDRQAVEVFGDGGMIRSSMTGGGMVKKKQSLAEIIASIPKLTLTEIPLSSITKDDYLRLQGHNPLDRFTRMMRSDSNRDLTLQMVGQIEIVLGLLLSSFVVEEVAEGLFGTNGKVRDFELKIDLAYGLGLIETSERNGLHVLRKVRNKFAHDPNLFHFEHDEKTLGLVQSLPMSSNAPEFDNPLRMRFGTYALHLQVTLEKRVFEMSSRRLKMFIKSGTA